ncbi:uncharacterized protein KNAG_0D03970 [Huiozyma naganishii CBS 8797]|uniref:Protein ORM1 n=1 Tax=Huiozyma naganishii (strain ATCC MYA-139 / BCRC 22969 / CBS 8797 / KCTC 17520 / NBRC 10181 / NCYC 3082 / Yp74L-3) TaxID=1071383 RepID=J7RKW7_HUIN7|nr:hypothetical protein KNAG_0D03970 [Kazachstania naganishii CBS 8797]CCK70143.1 hypothetical protein KNAG_0D03970 [Kazachstania naganishii CBS 8797]
MTAEEFTVNRDPRQLLMADLEPFPSYHGSGELDKEDRVDGGSASSTGTSSGSDSALALAAGASANTSAGSAGGRSRASSLSTSDPNEPVQDHRRRRSSSLISHVEQETLEDENDQHVFPNLNASWVSQRGAWIIHLVVIVLLKLFYNLLPGLNGRKMSWTLTNMTYNIGMYVMFHLIKGTPFDFNGGAYDNLTMWEQIDNETLYSPSRKFIICVPIALFILATHYSQFSFKLFIFNFVVTFCVGILPKLPVTHRLRVYIPFVNQPQQIS